jgi:hypothetical protein
MRDDRELMKLEGAEAINQLQDLADLIKHQFQPAVSAASKSGFDSLQSI